MEIEPKYLVSDVTQVMLTEYNMLMSEIRNIHDKRIIFYKIASGSIVALIGYLFAGILFYNKVVADHTDIPRIIAWAFSSFGLILTVAEYILVHNLYYHLGPSKKHTVRYWKAIHHIRAYFKEEFPKIKAYLLMPDINNYPMRPRLSHRWEQGVLLNFLYHLMFFTIAAFLLTPFMVPIEVVKEKTVLNLNKYGHLGLQKAIIYLWLFLMARIVLGSNALRRYWICIEEARKISDKPFIALEDVFPKNPSKLDKKALLFLQGIFIVLILTFCWGPAVDDFLKAMEINPGWNVSVFSLPVSILSYLVYRTCKIVFESQALIIWAKIITISIIAFTGIVIIAITCEVFPDLFLTHQEYWLGWIILSFCIVLLLDYTYLKIHGFKMWVIH